MGICFVFKGCTPGMERAIDEYNRGCRLEKAAREDLKKKRGHEIALILDRQSMRCPFKAENAGLKRLENDLIKAVARTRKTDTNSEYQRGTEILAQYNRLYESPHELYLREEVKRLEKQIEDAKDRLRDLSVQVWRLTHEKAPILSPEEALSRAVEAARYTKLGTTP